MNIKSLKYIALKENVALRLSYDLLFCHRKRVQNPLQEGGDQKFGYLCYVFYGRNLRIGQWVKNFTVYENSKDSINYKFNINVVFGAIKRKHQNEKIPSDKKNLMRCKYYRFFICYK